MAASRFQVSLKRQLTHRDLLPASQHESADRLPISAVKPPSGEAGDSLLVRFVNHEGWLEARALDCSGGSVGRIVLCGIADDDAAAQRRLCEELAPRLIVRDGTLALGEVPLVEAPAPALAEAPAPAPKPTSDSTMQALGEDGTMSTEPTSWTMLRGLFWLKLEGGPTLRLERTDPRKEQTIREVVQMGFDDAAVRAMQASLAGGAGEPSAEALVEALLSQ